MNKPPPILLSSAIIASSLTYAGCNMVRPAENPNLLSAYVPIEKTPRHPEKAASADQQADNEPAAPFANLLTETRIGIANSCDSPGDCSSGIPTLRYTLPANVCDTNSPVTLCAEGTPHGYLSPDPYRELRRQLQDFCLTILDDCETPAPDYPPYKPLRNPPDKAPENPPDKAPENPLDKP